MNDVDDDDDDDDGEDDDGSERRKSRFQVHHDMAQHAGLQKTKTKIDSQTNMCNTPTLKQHVKRM